MKKLLAILAVLMFAFASVAMADTENEIVFHNIPWGISINDLVIELKDRGIPVAQNDISPDENMAVWTYDFRNSYENDIEATGYAISKYFWNDVIVKIAGYPINQLQCYAHYDITDGILKKGAADSQYYMSSVWFDVSDEMAIGVYDDLVNKLVGLYGEGVEDSAHIVDTTYTYTVWKGASDTAVCLYRSVSTSSSYQHVNLMYGKTTIERNLREVRKMVIEDQIQSVANDTTGL